MSEIIAWSITVIATICSWWRVIIVHRRNRELNDLVEALSLENDRVDELFHRGLRGGEQ